MTRPTRLLVGVGTAAYLPCDLAVPLPDGHPSAQPGFQLMLAVEGQTIASADVRIGLMHRSMEKLYEARDYRQLMMLANRQDWMSSASTELLIALALEAAMGTPVPERASWIRTLLAEATRASAALAFLAPVLPDPTAARALRERLLQAQEAATGSRIHPMHVRIGGVAADLPDDVRQTYARLADDLAVATPVLHEQLVHVLDAHAGVAALSRADAIAFGLLGPVGRASGLARDVRVDEPYAVYGTLRELIVPGPTRNGGDIPARYAQLAHELQVAATLMAACTDALATVTGPVDVPLPKVVRAPEGTWLASVEGPLGRVSCVLASVGDKTPWRLAMRTPSFVSAQALGTALRGVPLTELQAAVMSFFVVPGDADR